MYTIIGSDGNEYGTVTLEQIRDWIVQGRVNSESLAKNNEIGLWKKIREFSELGDVGSGPPLLAESAPKNVDSRTVSKKEVVSQVPGLLRAMAMMIIGGIGVWYFWGGGLESHGAKDQEDQYAIAVRNGNHLDAAAHAQLAAAFYLQAKDDANYQKWTKIQQEETDRAVILPTTADVPNSNSEAPQAVSQAPTKPTKSQWREKLNAHYGQLAQLNVIAYAKTAEFKKFMGSPDRTETIGDEADWYYECSDGTVQLSLNAPNLAFGIMQGKINDF